MARRMITTSLRSTSRDRKIENGQEAIFPFENGSVAICIESDGVSNKVWPLSIIKHLYSGVNLASLSALINIPNNTF